MKFNKLAIAVLAVAAVPAANAGVTVSPLLLGYHYSDLKDTNDKQREILRVGKDLYADAENRNRNPKETRGLHNGGIAQKSDLYTGAAIGIELTPSTQFQVEYGVSNSKGEASKDSANLAEANRFDVKQEMISGNFLIGTEQFTGYTNSKFKPYVLVGGGQSKIKVKNRAEYSTVPRDINDDSEPRVNPKTGETYTYLPSDVSHEELKKTGYRVPAGTQVTSSRDTIGNLGLGAMYRINDALSLRGEGRAIYNFDNKWWEGMALAGLEVALGGHLAPKVPAPDLVEVEEVAVVEEPPEQEEVIKIVEEPVDIDSDGDGVPDRLDACPNTPRNLVVDARGCPKQIDVEENLKLELRVFFDNDKSNVKPQYKPEIQKVAQAMRDFPNSTALIEGYASKTGPSALYNLRLSEARALAVKSMLTNEYGVQPTRITTKGYGYSRPIAPNNTPEGRAMNRRVYAVITGTKKVRVDATKNGNVQ